MLCDVVDFVSRGCLVSDLAIIAASTKSTLLDIGKQANALGAGLQNAALGDRAGVPNPSVQYLLDIADELNLLAAKCDELIGHV